MWKIIFSHLQSKDHVRHALWGFDIHISSNKITLSLLFQNSVYNSFLAVNDIRDATMGFFKTINKRKIQIKFCQAVLSQWYYCFPDKRLPEKTFIWLFCFFKLLDDALYEACNMRGKSPSSLVLDFFKNTTGPWSMLWKIFESALKDRKRKVGYFWCW